MTAVQDSSPLSETRLEEIAGVICDIRAAADAMVYEAGSGRGEPQPDEDFDTAVRRLHSMYLEDVERLQSALTAARAEREEAVRNHEASERRARRADKIDGWLTAQAHRGEGVVVLGLTEDGNVGVWKPESRNPEDVCDGVGDFAFEAIERASRPLEGQRDA